MKLQHLAVIFVIIIIPISMVLSQYTSTHIKTIERQTQYNTRLINATYDAMKAFKVNTVNNRYSTLNNSKIRDIEASINVFYNTLGTSMKIQGYSSYDMKDYTPAILFNLYDGYYIYTNYYDTEISDYKYGIKPLVAYSCRYVKGNDYDFVVNYTLDNTITIVGKVDGEYVTKTGHLIYDDGTTMTGEVLTETLLTLDDAGNQTIANYEYVVYNSQKIYKENNITLGDENGATPYYQRYFMFSSQYKKDYVQDDRISNPNNSTMQYLLNHTNNGHLFSDSAQNYYNNGKEFVEWLKTSGIADKITVDDARDSENNPITYDNKEINGNNEIFNISANNNPLQTDSLFNSHRKEVIRKSIETNLISSIANYNAHSFVGYEFAMPKIQEDEWEKIENYVCVTAFLQGLPIGAKVFNNYCIISSNSNEETVGNDSIYFIVRNSSGNYEYHEPGCKVMIEQLKNGATVVGAYQNSDFERIAISLTGSDANAHTQLNDEEDTSKAYYYPQYSERNGGTVKAATGCYNCIVNASDAYSSDDILKNVDNIGDTPSMSGENLRTTYLRALSRCRQDLYVTNGYFGY